MFSRDFKQMALNALKGRWGLAVLTGLVVSLLTGEGISFNYNYDTNINFNYYAQVHFLGFAFMASLITIIIGGVVEIGYKKFNMKLIRDENPEFTDVFKYFNYITKGVGLVIIRGIFIFLWTLLFFIPGIIASYSYALAPYILADNPNMKVTDAISQSKKMMRGNKGRLFSLHLSFIGWYILSILTFGIGLLWVLPYMSASEAGFYESLKGQKFSAEDATSDFDHINWEE